MSIGKNSVQVTLWKCNSRSGQPYVSGYLDIQFNDFDLEEIKRTGSMRLPVVGYFTPKKHLHSPYLRVMLSRCTVEEDEFISIEEV